MIAIAFVALVFLVGCVPAPRAAQSTIEGSTAPAPPQEIRPLSIVLRVEPFDITDSGSSRNQIGLALFTARLVYLDNHDAPFPVLTESVPQLNSESWRVMPEGRMETTFKLRPNLTWHDGAPVTADDFIFTRLANAMRIDWGLSVSSISPIEQRAIEEIVAPDTRTVVIRWRQLHIDAATPDMKPLPRHILGPVLDQGVAEAFGSQAYWTTDYVGLGPFRITRWESGAFIDGAAFSGFALGKPKVERVRVTWSGDPNATLARLLAGDVDIALDQAIQFQQGATLRREWAPQNGGTVLIPPSQIRQLQAQHRTAYVNPASIHDVRVRRAVAHALDRQALADALLEGEGQAAETIAPPTVSYYDQVRRVTPLYAYDLRRTEQLMAEAGFTRGADGIFVSPAEGRHRPEVMGIAEGHEGQETTIVADYLRRAGIDAQLRLVPSAQLQQSDEMKATFPAWRTNYTGANRSMSAERALGSRAAGPENRWGGTNKMGWSHPEHDRLYDTWTKTLDRDERNQLMLQIIKLTNEELPYIPLYFNVEAVAYRAVVRGPMDPAIETTAHWNVHQWELRPS